MVHARLLFPGDAREERVTLGPNCLDEASVGTVRTAENIELQSAHAVVRAVVILQPCGKLESCFGAVEDGLKGRAGVVDELDGGRETKMRFSSLGVDSQEGEGWVVRVTLGYEWQVQVEVVRVQ